MKMKEISIEVNSTIVEKVIEVITQEQRDIYGIDVFNDILDILGIALVNNESQMAMEVHLRYNYKDNHERPFRDRNFITVKLYNNTVDDEVVLIETFDKVPIWKLSQNSQIWLLKNNIVVSKYDEKGVPFSAYLMNEAYFNNL